MTVGGADFYLSFSAVCFTLLGLGLIVVQTRHAEWRGNALARRRAYGVALHFSLPGLMSLLALVNPDSSTLWRASSASSPTPSRSSSTPDRATDDRPPHRRQPRARRHAGARGGRAARRSRHSRHVHSTTLTQLTAIRKLRAAMPPRHPNDPKARHHRPANNRLSGRRDGKPAHVPSFAASAPSLKSIRLTSTISRSQIQL